MSDDLLERMTKALREEGGAEPSPERSVMVRARVMAQTKRRAQLRPQGMWQWAAVICLGFFVSTAMAQVIRVQLPRSTLTSFGFPVNAERWNEPVKADVVMGHDGIARAIRFVR